MPQKRGVQGGEGGPDPLSEAGLEGNFLDLTKSIYSDPTADVTGVTLVKNTFPVRLEQGRDAHSHHRYPSGGSSLRGNRANNLKI